MIHVDYVAYEISSGRVITVGDSDFKVYNPIKQGSMTRIKQILKEQTEAELMANGIEKQVIISIVCQFEIEDYLPDVSLEDCI
jgi:hypothetical protein